MRQTLCVLVPAKQLEVSNVILLNQIEKVTMAGQFIVDLTSNATTTPPTAQVCWWTCQLCERAAGQRALSLSLPHTALSYAS